MVFCVDVGSDPEVGLEEESFLGELKKQKLGNSENENSDEEEVQEIDGEMESQQTVETDQGQVSTGVGAGSEQEPEHVSERQAPEDFC